MNHLAPPLNDAIVGIEVDEVRDLPFRTFYESLKAPLLHTSDRITTTRRNKERKNGRKKEKRGKKAERRKKKEGKEKESKEEKSAKIREQNKRSTFIKACRMIRSLLPHELSK